MCVCECLIEEDQCVRETAGLWLMQATYPRHCQMEHPVGELGEELPLVRVSQVGGLEASLLLDGGGDGLGESEMGGLL